MISKNIKDEAFCKQNTAPVEPRLTAEQLAQKFHEAYERLAPQFSYETRKASAKPWAEVPENNRKLMTAVCAEILEAFRDNSEAGLREEIERLKDINDCLSKDLKMGEDELGRTQRKLEAEEDEAKILEERAEAAEAEVAALRTQQESWRKGTESNMKSMAKLAENLKEELGEALREAAALREREREKK